MARAAERLSTNVEGDFFVDSTCIDCDACRIIAPAVFAGRGGQSAVVHQPAAGEELLAAQKALVSCPTASIGDLAKRNVSGAIAALPELIDQDVLFCGFTSESSFGALSYFIRRERGNVLVDSPRFNAQLARNLERRGGLASMLLTHRDDVADHQKFRDRFGCERVIHADDATRGTAGVERKPEGHDPVELDDELLMIPVPGHTRGHAVYLYRSRFLFTGDHLAWSARRGHLYAFRSACWYSWSAQIESMKKLLDYSFEWVLPGHGHRIHLPAAEMRASLEKCIDWMSEH